MITGLTSSKAKDYLTKYGPNLLPDKQTSGALSLLIYQFKNILSIILIIALLLSFFIGDQIDGFLILIILLLNTLLGFWQEYKASKELAALRKLEVSTSRVIRDGIQLEIPSSQIVPEDVVILEAGDKIPADGKIEESFDLSVNESSLTGESLPVVKSESVENNLLYFGTTVSAGRAKIQIISTGSNTRFGKIALTLSSVGEEPTPLEVSLNSLAKKIGIIALLISSLVFVIMLTQGQKLLEVFFTSIALMVAAVPEGLPAIITVLLALGVQRMYKKKTLVRKMSAIESLGATNIICTDKTGTLTMNQMRVVEIFISKENLQLTIKASVLCNSASLMTKEDRGTFDILGDTTEGALLLWAKENNIDYEQIRANGKIVDELAFNLKRRMMSVTWKEGSKITVFSKGAPEVILPLCKLSKARLNELNKKYKSLAAKGLRVLAIAYKQDSETTSFLGLVGIADAPRLEAKEAIAKARQAGIEVVMITGDNELTAKRIAEELSLLREDDEILTGSQLDELTDEQFLKKIDKIRIFARVIPEHKLRIIQAYQKLGKVVAVTGDGVNDALALKQAHVGVAMGITGTDVAKEAANIVILDDNLSTIILAVEQGRVIYSNILKVVKFLLTGNLSEVITIVGIILAGFPTPLLPVQILWINFVTDGLPALSLAADSASTNIMHTPPREKSQSILNYPNLKFILFFGSLIAAINILLFIWGHNFFGLQTARSLVFTSVVISQMILIFLIRRHHSIISNKYLVLSVGLVLIMQALILFSPPLQTIFKL